MCGAMLTIGRSRTNDVLLHDSKVSRTHALIRCLGDGNYYLTDAGSANGTFVNDARIVVPRALVNADRIRVGDHIMEFMTDQEAPVEESDEEETGETKSTLLTFGSVVHRITVLVSDIRGYTLMSEKMPVHRLADMLGRWFGSCSEIVARHGGVVDKFIGDAVMVRWLSDAADNDETVLLALRTAHAMNLASQQFNAEFPDLPGLFRIGVGINTGQAVVGSLGSVHGRDYTAVGDAVNLAFRLESSTKELRTDVVLGPDSYKRLPKAVWEQNLRSIAVKGKEKPVTVCTFSFDHLAIVVPE
ncbi:MAG: hypothetical protein A3K18_04510 [Lentisphaerae bacterium RIFOXYA12_64_32]|nr:MAG: hypothetical protein A3K18_04510 [Lentisphaerae bacterium RIFOXYA12_64_32]